jgi:hypothetical protein
MSEEDLIIKEKKRDLHVYLSMYEVENKGYWAERYFGDPTKSYLFDVFITNIDYAIRQGYYMPNFRTPSPL